MCVCGAGGSAAEIVIGLILTVFWSGGCTPNDKIRLPTARSCALSHPARWWWSRSSDSDVWFLSCHNCREANCLHSLDSAGVFHSLLFGEDLGDIAARNSLDF